MEGAVQFLLVASLLFWGLSWFFFARLRFVPPSGVREGSRVAVSLVIPARDEEENLETLLAAVSPERDLLHEIIVVDDHSEDETAKVARKHGASVVEGESLPDGWLGKPWACFQGAGRATGDWLLFMDADTAMEPGGVAAVVSLIDGSDEVHSICPYHVVHLPYEQLSGFFNVIMVLGINAFTWRGAEGEEIGLFGQSLLISQTRYRECDGHRAVKGEVLENFHLARSLSAMGCRLHCWLGRGAVRMRMFPQGLRSLIEGWSKGAVAGAANSSSQAVVGVAAWLSGLSMGSIGLLLSLIVGGKIVLWASLVYVLCAIQVGFLFRSVGRFSMITALLFPVHLLFYNGVFFRAWLRRRRGQAFEWKGRHVS